MNDSQSANKKPLAPRITGVALIALLPGIAVCVAMIGWRYDPARDQSRTAETPRDTAASGAPGAQSYAEPPAPGGPAQASADRVIPVSLLPPVEAGALYQAAGPAQFFDTKTIYEKIDGAAPEYLELGFRELMTQEYAAADPGYFGCEVFIYEMGESRNAKAIYDKQGGAGAETIGLGDSAYRFGATWFFHEGPYYVIVLNADEGGAAERFSEQLAQGLAQRIDGVPGSTM